MFKRMVIMTSRTQKCVLFVVLLLVSMSLLLPLDNGFIPNLNRESTTCEDHENTLTTPVSSSGADKLMVTRSSAARADENSNILYFKEKKDFNNVELFSNSTIIFHKNLTITSRGKVTFRNCTLLSQNNSMEKSILVQKNGTLVLENVVMALSNASTANSSVLEHSSYSLESRGYIKIANTTLKDYRFFNIIYSDSSLETLRLETSKRDGIYFKSSTSQISSLHIISPMLNGINCALSNLAVKNLKIENAGENGLYIKDSTVNLYSTLTIESEKAELDIGLATTVVTDNTTIRDMSINFRDSESKVVIQKDGKTEELTQPKKSSSSSEKLMVFLVPVVVVLLILLLIYAWIRVREVFQKVSTQSFGYEGEKLEAFRQRSREGEEKPKEEQRDILFEFGKMAMKAGTHSKALSYFTKMVSLCESEKETYVYLVQIYEKARTDPDVQKHYRELLTPIYSMKEDRAIVLFEFGKMAMNTRDHNKALAYFTKMVPLCENEEERDSYLRQIYDKTKKDPGILDKYRSLLSPVLIKDEDAEKRGPGGSFGDEEEGKSSLTLELDESREEKKTADSPMVGKEKSPAEKERLGANSLAKTFRKALKK